MVVINCMRSVIGRIFAVTEEWANGNFLPQFQLYICFSLALFYFTFGFDGFLTVAAATNEEFQAEKLKGKRKKIAHAT